MFEKVPKIQDFYEFTICSQIIALATHRNESTINSSVNFQQFIMKFTFNTCQFFFCFCTLCMTFLLNL